jgi:bifunctional oligoribonuclease and PAP phosphatase NrnA
MPSHKIIDQILKRLRRSQSFCIVGHVRPDGDCIGSQLALALALRKRGRQVVCWNEDPIPRKLAFLDPDQLLQPPAPGHSFDCVIATDCASLKRLGRAADCIGLRKCFINIDHHRDNNAYADLNWIAPHAPSTGELIFQLFKSAGWAISPPVADCLFTAISTDTGSFQYPTTQPATYQIAGELVRRGANLARISDQVYQSSPLGRVRLLQHLYNRFRLSPDQRIAFLWLRQRDYQRTGAQPDDSEGLIDHIRSIEPVVVACLFEELEPNLIRISLRSKSDQVRVNEIAATFGGGGHRAAAGARVQGPPLTVQRRVLDAIKNALPSPLP